MLEYLAAGETGSDTFTYTVSDGNGGIDSATVTITVTGVNDTPVANANSYNVKSDETLVVAAPGVMANDVDIDGDPLTAVLVSGPSRGTLVLDPDGSFAYVPDLNFEGTVTFTYKVTDGLATSNTVVVTIEIKLAGGPSPPGSSDPPPKEEDPPSEEDPPIDETLLPEPIADPTSSEVDVAGRARSTRGTVSPSDFIAGPPLALDEVEVSDLYFFDTLSVGDFVRPIKAVMEAGIGSAGGFVNPLVMWNKLDEFRNELEETGNC